MTKKAVLEALRSLPKNPEKAQVVEVDGFTLWREQNYAMPGQNRRFAWKWIYYGKHPAEQYNFGGCDSLHTMADIVVRINRRQERA